MPPIFFGAPRLRLAQALFLSRGNFNNFWSDFLCNFPIVFYPEMGYYNNCQGVVRRTVTHIKLSAKLER